MMLSASSERVDLVAVEPPRLGRKEPGAPRLQGAPAIEFRVVRAHHFASVDLWFSECYPYK
jgi:hypothetical protein